MGLSFPQLSSVFLMIVMGLNQPGSEPGMYWDKVLPNTPMPSAIKKLLPQVVVMKPADSEEVVDGGFYLGRKGAGDKFDPISNGQPIESRNSNNPPAIPANHFPIIYSASKKPDAFENVVDSGVTKSNHPSAIPANHFPYIYSANKKPDASENVVDSEVTKFNHPSAIPANHFPYIYSANKKPDASENVVDSGVTKFNHPSAIPANYFEFIYSANQKSDDSRNVAYGGVNFIEGTNSNHPSAIPANHFPYIYSASKNPDASENVANDGVNISPREAGVKIDKNFDPIAAIFFHRHDLLPGKQFNLLLISEDGRSAPFIPRQEADAIPFSTSELPSILSRYSIPPGSNVAVKMRNTLDMCEMQTVAGVERQCVTSLEAMVDFATKKLNTHDVAAVAMEGGDAYAAEVRPYKVKAVKRIAMAGGKGVVSCHPLPYAYAVFYCHHSTTNEVYSVDLIVEDDGATMMKVVAVCHLDTSMWKPETSAFKVLGLEPGKGAVCHFLLRMHVSWVAKL